jgi:methionyl-tRNA formyltransferase
VHYSLLPSLRGAAPVQRALAAGMAETGVTVQWMSPVLDAGDILLQARAPIEPDDNQAALFARLTEIGVPLLLRSLDLIAAGAAPRSPQDEGQVTWAPELTKAECHIDWSKPALQIRNLIAACSPSPGAYAFRGKRRLKVLDARVAGKSAAAHKGQPGAVVELDSDGRPVVAAGSGVVVLVTVQPEGRRMMSGEDFARGAAFSPGERLT